MAYEELREPRMISYLDLYVYAGMQPHMQNATIQKVKSYSKDVLMGLPQLPMKDVLKYLKEMGMDVTKEVEERVCFHKPVCLAVATRKEDKPQVYGLAYFGLERIDPDYKKDRENW